MLCKYKKSSAHNSPYKSCNLQINEVLSSQPNKNNINLVAKYDYHKNNGLTNQSYKL